METYWRAQKRWTFYIVSFALIWAVLALLSHQLPFAKGVAIGGLMAVFSFRLLALTAEKAVNMPPTQAQRYAFNQYVIRYTLTGVVIALILLRPDIDLLGAILGLLSLKLLLYGYAIWGTVISCGRSWLTKVDHRETDLNREERIDTGGPHS